MLKILGVILIIFGTGIFGERCVGVLKTRIRALEGLVKLIESMEAKISGFSMPTAKFFATYSDKYFEDIGFLNACRDTDIATAVSEYKSILCLDDAEHSLMIEFAGELGQYTAAEQLRRCTYYRTELEKMLREAKEKLPVNTKLLRSSGIMCGILAAVLLI